VPTSGSLLLLKQTNRESGRFQLNTVSDMRGDDQDRARAPKYLSIRDFDRLQHYHDRPLIWIKLHVDLLDDFEFQQLGDETKFHLIGLMLLAARMGNRLPNNANYLSRQIGANSPIDLEILLRRKFLIPAKRKRPKGQSASTSLARLEKVASIEQTKGDKSGDYMVHTTTEQNAHPSSAVGGYNSKHSLEVIMQYVKDCQHRGQAIRSPQGLANALRKTGDTDEQIDDFLRRRNAPKRAQADPSCERCHGTGSEVVEGKGARECPACFPDCRENEQAYIAAAAGSKSAFTPAEMDGRLPPQE
jgi:hypothetical protein